MDEKEMIEKAVRQVARIVGVFIIGVMLCGLIGLLMGACVMS